MAESIITNFPSQVVSDAEKCSSEYGLKIAKAIEREWFEGTSSNRYSLSKTKYHNLRKYARGEQSVQKYKNELSINGDLSYLNLDWTPVPIIPKFVDIVVNGMAQRTYDVKAYSQDEYGMAKRTEYMESVLSDMRAREFNDTAKATLNIDLYKNDPELLPETEQELALHMQLTYKQQVELANEQAINVLLEGSKYDLVKRRCLYDLTVCGIGCVKTTFNWSEGAKVEYVDPANIIYSHSESPYFDDIYYIGEVKNIPINELVREFPHLTDNDLNNFKRKHNRLKAGDPRHEDADVNKVQILYFNYKTYMNDVYKVKTTSTGGERAIEKTDQFNPPEDKMTDYSKMQRSVECL